jgi:hypothetical protein
LIGIAWDVSANTVYLISLKHSMKMSLTAKELAAYEKRLPKLV